MCRLFSGRCEDRHHSPHAVVLQRSGSLWTQLEKCQDQNKFSGDFKPVKDIQEIPFVHNQVYF